jgi:hypothetical protein
MSPTKMNTKNKINKHSPNVMGIIFRLAVWYRKESISQILLNPSFFKIVAAMGVIAATVVLSLAGRLEGNLNSAILSGTVGYVLGSITG